MKHTNAENFSKDIQNLILESAEEIISDEEFEVECPHCNASILVTNGENICPECNNIVELTLNIDL